MSFEHHSEAGFTLVEMLAVLMILALTVTLSAPFLSRGAEGLRLQTASSELATSLRATRSAAILRHMALTLLIDVDRRRFGSSVVSQRSFAPDIEAKLTFASGIRSAASDGGFQFFPDGSSTGGDVTLSLHGNQTKVCVDWLTGGVREAASC
jgi:general secretion pathway protein H